jgi:hypothetical protein
MRGRGSGAALSGGDEHPAVTAQSFADVEIASIAAATLDAGGAIAGSAFVAALIEAHFVANAQIRKPIDEVVGRDPIGSDDHQIASNHSNVPLWKRLRCVCATTMGDIAARV